MPEHTIIPPDILPRGSSVTFESSSFFPRNSPKAALPTPAEILAQRDVQYPQHKGSVRDLPVIFEDLGLFVKYGQDPYLTISEGQCLWAIRHFLPQVPVPEIYGWHTEGDDIFLYMEYIPGLTLKTRWAALSRPEKVDVCKQLKTMVTDLQSLRQEPGEQFVGKYLKLHVQDFKLINVGDIQGGPLGDIVFTNGVLPRAGPFSSVSGFHDWLSAMFKRPALLHLPGLPLSEVPDPYRDVLPDDSRITFTHADLNPVNIMVSEDSPCRVLAIVDWQQSGWYPAYWEYCKAEYTIRYGEQWHLEYLPLILEEPSCVEGFHGYANAFGH